jgi:PLP dependent protein
VAANFDWVHSVDRPKIAERLSQQRPALRGPLNICLQVNISNEATKSGFTAEEALHQAGQIAQLPNLVLRGLMCIPAPADTIEAQRLPFKQLFRLFDALKQQGLKLDTLSMGMSTDLEPAILEGSTMVRVGSAIFGARDAR